MKKGNENFGQFVIDNQIDDQTLKSLGHDFDKSGWSMIHYAVNLGRVGILKKFIEV